MATRTGHHNVAIDDTFAAIVLRASQDNKLKPWLYFRFTDHGGLTDDPLEASRLKIDEHLWMAEAHAMKNWPNYIWERARLIVSVEPFSSPAVTRAMDESITTFIRRQALAKLSLNERKALGV